MKTTEAVDSPKLIVDRPEKKHWLIVHAEEDDLGNYLTGDLEAKIDQLFIGAIYQLTESPDILTPNRLQDQRELVAAHKEAGEIVRIRWAGLRQFGERKEAA